MKINKGTFIIKIMLTLSFIVSNSVHSHVKALTLDWQSLIVENLENEFTQKGKELKGNVFSVVRKRVTPHNEKELLDSIIFSKEGNILKVYRNPSIFSIEKGMFLYTITPDSVIKKGRIMWSDDIVMIEIVRDSNNRIKEYKKYKKDGSLFSKIIFNYTADGYDGEYWPYHENKITFSLKGNVLTFKQSGLSGKYVLNKNNKPIKLTWTNSFWGFGPKDEYWKYDNHGNVLEDPENIGKIEYQYDSVGNWISKKQYKADGRVHSLEIREITYMNPVEWENYEKEQIEAQNLLNQEILNKASEKTSEFIVYKLEDFLYDLDRNQSLQRSGLEIKNFDIKSDLYAFTFPDGTRVDNIKFDRKDIGSNSEKFISENNSIVLYSNFSSDDGLNWYVMKFDSEFDPMPKVDWVAEYKKTFAEEIIFGNYEDNFEERENEFYNDILYEQWEEFCNANNSPMGFKGTMYKIENPYENGFESPSIADKAKEKELLETWRAQKEFDDRLDQIFKLLKTEGKEIAKIKKFKVDDRGSYSSVRVYSFKLKDNIDHNEITFNSIGADKRLLGSKHNNKLRGFLDRNKILISEDGDFAIFVLDRASWWNTKKPVLVFDLKNNIVNFISGKDWVKLHTHK